MSLFQLGDFWLSSGAISRWKLECDALTDDDWAALAEMISQMVGPFCHCVSVPRGGDKLQNMLSPRATFGPVLIVDDVLTTGGSIERAKRQWREKGDGGTPPGDFTRTMPIVGAVVFARGKCPPWVRALFQMPEELFIKK